MDFVTVKRQWLDGPSPFRAAESRIGALSAPLSKLQNYSIGTFQTPTIIPFLFVFP
jgi:hypothetical protein